MHARTVAVVVLSALVALAGCSDEPSTSPTSSDSAPATSSRSAKTRSTSTKPGVTLPKGVRLTQPGSRLRVGQRATVVYRADAKRRSAVTISVTRIRKGSMEDFENFSLSAKQRASTPFYVDVVVRNDGPGRLDRAAVPLYGLDSTNTYFSPVGLVGEFDRCRGGALPKRFTPGDKAKRCLVFLVPKKARLKALQVRTRGLDEPVGWRYRRR